MILLKGVNNYHSGYDVCEPREGRGEGMTKLTNWDEKGERGKEVKKTANGGSLEPELRKEQRHARDLVKGVPGGGGLTKSIGVSFLQQKE